MKGVTLVLAALALLLAPAVRADEPVVKQTEPGNGATLSRDYYVHVPPKLAAPKKRSLVLLLHGCAQTAADLWQGVGWNELADAEGFVVAYPEQSTGTDGNGARCWNSGQAPAFARGEGELEVIAGMTRTLAAQYRIPAGRVFIGGLSSGALMSAAMAATYPDLYAAFGSIVGCGYPCGEPTGVPAWNRMASYARRVPAIFVAGDADYLIDMGMSQGGVAGWVGANDLADDGERNQSVAATPVTEDRGSGPAQEPSTDLCVQPYNNPCAADAAGWTDYPATISRYLDAADGSVVVESWVLHGLSHAYPGGDRTAGTYTDPHGPDATRLLYDFFVSHVRAG